jgi:hypothetical protein
MAGVGKKCKHQGRRKMGKKKRKTRSAKFRKKNK